jgi:hypothetical protein
LLLLEERNSLRSNLNKLSKSISRVNYKPFT